MLSPPYDWPAMLAFLGARAIPGLEAVSGDGYARAIEISGVRGTVSVRPGEGNTLRASIQFPRLSALPTIVARLRRVFDLAADPAVIGAHLAEDAVLAPLVAARPGLRVLVRDGLSSLPRWGKVTGEGFDWPPRQGDLTANGWPASVPDAMVGHVSSSRARRRRRVDLGMPRARALRWSPWPAPW
jgi:AraC family transcriptional regulator of adaptative response / DNA-3-methyladenine glycosylase II